MDTFRGMDRRALSEAYNNRSRVPDWETYLARWVQRSDTLYGTAKCLRDLHYDDRRPRNRFDVFEGADRRLPTCLYMHGGYWQWNDKEGQAFVAEGLLTHGATVAIGEHSLAPAVTMTEMGEEMHALVAAVSRQAREAGRNPGVVLVGMSSGAHLLALTLGSPAVASAALISGAYDLEPVRISSLNDAIGMDAAEARAHSPLHLPQTTPKPVVVAFGGDELPEIRRQGTDFHAVLLAQEFPAELRPIDGTDHFSVLETLADPHGQLCREVLELAKRSAS